MIWIPLRLQIFAHIGLGWIAYAIFLWLQPISEGVAALWGLIAACVWLYDIARWANALITAYKALPDIERAIRHFSQGAATMVLAAFAARWLTPNIWGVFDPKAQGRWMFVILFVVPFAVGLVRVIAGMIDAWGHPFRFMTTLMALLRCAAGIAILWYNWPPPWHLILDYDREFRSQMATVAGSWLAVTGIMRIMIVSGLVYALTFIGAHGYARLRRAMKKEKPIYGVPTISRK